ncbi:MAG: N-acetylmuramoyl-L-alanine amidase, partial [Bacteroidia bacterium]|nr:N-acetylmuramoyl-L-alanine amidase [Bacteroidia bacterium]
MRKGRILFFVLSFLPWLTSFRGLKPVWVVVDPGHGGKDPGAKGKLYKEKDITLAVSLKLA